MANTKDIVCKNLKTIRMSKPQDEFQASCERLGFDETHWLLWEDGVNIPVKFELRDIAIEFGIDPEDIDSKILTVSDYDHLSPVS